jgi:peptidyl-prolyl cis-trans isomerase SurA
MRLFCVILVAVATSVPQVKAEPRLAGGVEAIVHDSVITTYQVARNIEPLMDSIANEYRSQPEVMKKEFENLRQDTREVLLENQLILHDFQTTGYNLPESIIDEQLQNYIRTAFLNDRVKFIKTLQAQGKTSEQYRREFRERLIVEQMRLMHSESDVFISPHKIEVFYVDNKEKFKEEDQVKLRMIILNKPADDSGQTRKLADDILAKLKEGVSFAEMANVNSPNGASGGGERNWERPSGLKKELADAIVTLKPGENSEVVDTPEACYLMRLEDKRPEHIKPLNEVRDEIEATLLRAEHERLQKQWIERLKKKTFYRYF